MCPSMCPYRYPDGTGYYGASPTEYAQAEKASWICRNGTCVVRRGETWIFEKEDLHTLASSLQVCRQATLYQIVAYVIG
jgi:hypothetical protein